jgi:hypothetical protein
VPHSNQLWCDGELLTVGGKCTKRSRQSDFNLKESGEGDKSGRRTRGMLLMHLYMYILDLARYFSFAFVT